MKNVLMTLLLSAGVVFHAQAQGPVELDHAAFEALQSKDPSTFTRLELMLMKLPVMTVTHCMGYSIRKAMQEQQFSMNEARDGALHACQVQLIRAIDTASGTVEMGSAGAYRVPTRYRAEIFVQTNTLMERRFHRDFADILTGADANADVEPNLYFEATMKAARAAVYPNMQHWPDAYPTPLADKIFAGTEGAIAR